MHRSNVVLASRRGFTLIEVVISLVILGIGVIFLLRLFPTGVQRSAESERLTRATLLAQEILEAIKSQGGSGLVQIVPGSPELVPMPGDGVDTDEDGMEVALGVWKPNELVDLNANGVLDADYDGYPEPDYAGRLTDCDGKDFDARGCPTAGDEVDEVDNDLDGIVDDDGDSNACGRGVRFVDDLPFPLPQNPDGDLHYDPELWAIAFDPFGRPVLKGVDDEWPDGEDNDNDGTGIDVNGDFIPDIRVDEDVRLASNYHVDDWGVLRWWPLEPGDKVDNDFRPGLPSHQWEDGGPEDSYGRPVADGIDNDEDGRIDEGIDEEVFNGLDDDGDGLTDEDCRAASYPFTPRKFFRRLMHDDDFDGLTDEDPYDGRDNDGDGSIDEDPLNDDSDQFAWQIIVARVPDGGGDGINNDGDFSGGSPLIDEEIRDGLNDDPQCDPGSPVGDDLVDEDCQAAPVRGFRRITVRITWNGNRDDNRDGFPGYVGIDDDGDGGTDFGDPEIVQGMLLDAVFLGIDLSGVSAPEEIGILAERWAQDDDEDGRIDEETLNGIDDDLDGLIDEDYYRNEYNLTGFLEL